MRDVSHLLPSHERHWTVNGTSPLSPTAGRNAPFDALAADYDASFTETLLGRLLRDAVHAEVQTLFAPGDRVLDLGCGTGEDAVRLAGLGVSVHGIDASEEMVEQARAKAALRCGREMKEDSRSGTVGKPNVGSRAVDAGPVPSFEVVDLNRAPLPRGTFDGAFSNFGVINCLLDRHAFAARLHRALVPGAQVVFVVMGRYCPWEWVWYLARARPKTAFRRLRGEAVFRGHTIRYPIPSELARDFNPYFRAVRTTGLGPFLPPTFAASLIERHPRVARLLAAMDQRTKHRPLAAMLSDHYVVRMVRV